MLKISIFRNKNGILLVNHPISRFVYKNLKLDLKFTHFPPCSVLYCTVLCSHISRHARYYTAISGVHTFPAILGILLQFLVSTIGFVNISLQYRRHEAEKRLKKSLTQRSLLPIGEGKFYTILHIREKDVAHAAI